MVLGVLGCYMNAMVTEASCDTRSVGGMKINRHVRGSQNAKPAGTL